MAASRLHDVTFANAVKMTISAGLNGFLSRVKLCIASMILFLLYQHAVCFYESHVNSSVITKSRSMLAMDLAATVRYFQCCRWIVVTSTHIVLYQEKKIYQDIYLRQWTGTGRFMPTLTSTVQDKHRK